jgi:YfiH family protein
MFLISPNLTGIPHGFFTRKGGVSEGVYASLNCGPGSGDAIERVIENRRRMLLALGKKDARLLSLHQVHGSNVVTVEAPWRHAKKPKADAMVTTKPGIALSILTADCVPVLFADKKNRVIGAAHAGWKGALAGVLERTLEAMCAAGASLEHIHAGIGPCIAQKSYEVAGDFRASFIGQSTDAARYFIPAPRPGHFLFDLRGFVGNTLVKAGLRHVNSLENDTYMEEDAFFSFRRTTHRGERDYGRQISAIMLT